MNGFLNNIITWTQGKLVNEHRGWRGGGLRSTVINFYISLGELIAWIQRYLNGRNQGQGTTLRGIQKQLPRYLKSVYNLQNLKKVLQDNSHIIKQDRGCFRLIYQQEDELRGKSGIFKT